ncbi:MAG: hypothetical protein FWG68_02915, partial [Defluviitaleaceae bacterium]|nr:hypothetical protein [Defluviitaleaceae bacterium]
RPYGWHRCRGDRPRSPVVKPPTPTCLPTGRRQRPRWLGANGHPFHYVHLTYSQLLNPTT